MRAKSNDINTRERTKKRRKKPTNWFFAKSNETNQLLACLAKRKREKANINNKWNKGDLTNDAANIRKIISRYFEQFSANKFEYFD